MGGGPCAAPSRRSSGSMGTFFRKWWGLLVPQSLLVAAIQVFARPSPPIERTEPVRATGVALFRPFFLAVDSVREGVSGVWNRYIALVGVTRENERLRREVVALREQLHGTRDAILENRRLKDLLRYSQTACRPKSRRTHIL